MMMSRAKRAVIMLANTLTTFKQMTQFHKNNIDPEWSDLAVEFSEFIFEPSPFVIEMTEKWAGTGDWPDSIEDCCNLRYGFECGVGWKEIIREHFISIRNLIENAKNNGHEIYYKACILKQKFGSCRDQGDFYGADSKIYYKEYTDLISSLYEKSTKVSEKYNG